MSDLVNMRDWRTSTDVEGIMWAVFDREGESQNSLSRRALEELGLIVGQAEQAAKAKTIKGLVFISGKEKGFIVGADVREFELMVDAKMVAEAVRVANALLDRIENLPVAVVCCIHGFCLGGGLELALACHWRIATRDEATRFGFPEVKLGIFPGFNGTVRSIRQAGAIAAMPIMLAGSMVRANAARAMGLVDELVPAASNLTWAARKAVERKRKSRPARGLKALASKWPMRGFLAGKMRAETAKRVRETHYPAPFRLIDLFDKYGGSVRRMKVAETEMFAPLMVSDTSRNLRRVFKLSEMLKGQAPKGLDWKPLRVHVIGAGVMGADIAGWCVASGMEVTLQDMNVDAIAKGIERQSKMLARKFKTKPLRDAAKARLIADPTGAGISRADVVIEAIVEKLEIKQKLFAEIETKLKPGAVMATNTSSIMIEDIAKPLSDPGRLIGIHFFNPVAQMPLVEVIKGTGTRDEEAKKGCAFVAAIDKFPLIVRSAPGFVVNRVLGPYMMSAMERMEKGEKKEVIDEAARAFGMPMGPIELADTVGLDVCANVGRILGQSAEGTMLEELVKAGKLGKKSGAGFYTWVDGKAQKAQVTAAAALLEKLGRELVEPLVAECEKVRDEGVVANADLVDAGVIFGTGFAPFRGGPLHYLANQSKAASATPSLSVQAAE